MNEIVQAAIDAGPVVAGFSAVGTLFVAYKVGKLSTKKMICSLRCDISVFNQHLLTGRRKLVLSGIARFLQDVPSPWQES